jgi:hypothetical protein
MRGRTTSRPPGTVRGAWLWRRALAGGAQVVAAGLAGAWLWPPELAGGDVVVAAGSLGRFVVGGTAGSLESVVEAAGSRRAWLWQLGSLGAWLWRRARPGAGLRQRGSPLGRWGRGSGSWGRVVDGGGSLGARRGRRARWGARGCGGLAGGAWLPAAVSPGARGCGAARWDGGGGLSGAGEAGLGGVCSDRCHPRLLLQQRGARLNGREPKNPGRPSSGWGAPTRSAAPRRAAAPGSARRGPRGSPPAVTAARPGPGWPAR